MSGHCFLIKGGIHTRGDMPLYQIHRVIGLPCDHLNEPTVRYRPT